MKMQFLSRWFLIGLLVLGGGQLQAANETALIEVLRSSANAVEKCNACAQLRVVGTAQSVPALAALLTNEAVAHAARYALEAIPGAEAGAALRTALGQTTGMFKVGVIQSLGHRRDPQALPLLAPLLADADAPITTAAAAALGELGGVEATAALKAAAAASTKEARLEIDEALLRCAEKFLAAGDSNQSVAIYGDLANDNMPAQIRIAAWRGLVLAQPDQRVALISQSLANPESLTHAAALQLLRELSDAQVIEAARRQWDKLPSESQAALVDASVRAGKNSVAIIHAAARSPELNVRLAAWEALAQTSDVALLPELAQATASAQPEEQSVARAALAQLHGPGVASALRQQIEQGTPPVKAALLRALGERSDRTATDLLLRYAENPEVTVRRAALGALQQLAVPDTFAPLLEIVARTKSAAERSPVMAALFAIGQTTSDRETPTRQVMDRMEQLPVDQRVALLPLLVELATPSALSAVAALSRAPDVTLAREGIRALSEWPNAAAAPILFDLAKSGPEATQRLVALSGGITVAEQEPNLDARFKLLQQALALAQRPEEKRQALGALGQIPTPAALQIVLGVLADPDLANEAGLAAMNIAEKLAAAQSQLAAEAAAQVLRHSQSPAVLKRAWALRSPAGITAPFIQDWLVCGPFRVAGVTGATAIFDVAFSPEAPEAVVDWKPLPRADLANLALFFPNQTDCVAYLKAEINAPEARPAVLLLGSDDGVKAWLNGAEVHRNNVDRGLVADQDVALVELKQGVNELRLKITQGAGGWVACARLVGMEGQPIPGLTVKEQGGAAAAAAPVVRPAVPALLPRRDPFRKLQLSDQFYAEGAACADFNQDGQLDIVAGPFWYAGPDFTQRHEYRPAQTFDPRDYSDNFLTYTGDFNGDGRPDVLCIPYPGKEGYWYENPGAVAGPWPRHLYYPMVGNESPSLADMNGDGRPELIFNNDGYIGYAAYQLAKPEAPWTFHAVSPRHERYQRFTHGIGAGDLNGDGRMDLLEAAGWWEQPVNAAVDAPWIFHPHQFAEAASHMLVTDVDGDGLNDVICSWHCHLYGLLWWQQQRAAGGNITWQRHEILSPHPDVTSNQFRFSQPHSMALADMNGDGLMDFVTGKRFWAHGPTGDQEPDAPAIVCWFELWRDANGSARFVPHLIDDDSGVGTEVTVADLNADGRPDVIVANKKGVFAHFNELPRR
ncbi:MAG: FG-GAP-like repeat-containing protein [Verrucomicrobiae bacterium]|nr:FG-GAP-like repeat-containing protein [Verrucomicrobiae bacterium]